LTNCISTFERFNQLIKGLWISE